MQIEAVHVFHEFDIAGSFYFEEVIFSYEFFCEKNSSYRKKQKIDGISGTS